MPGSFSSSPLFQIREKAKHKTQIWLLHVLYLFCWIKKKFLSFFSSYLNSINRNYKHKIDKLRSRYSRWKLDSNWPQKLEEILSSRWNDILANLFNILPLTFVIIPVCILGLRLFVLKQLGSSFVIQSRSLFFVFCRAISCFFLFHFPSSCMYNNLFNYSFLSNPIKKHLKVYLI